MEYLIKSSAITIIFYVCYKLFLQKETFFQSNRWFLLSGIVIAFTLPFLVIPVYVEYTPESFQIVTTDQLTNNFTQDQSNTVTIKTILSIIYIIVSFILLVRLILQYLSLNKILKSGISKSKNKYKLIETSSNIAPFSFFNTIVVNPKNFNEKELEQVITHEKTHARQLHSIDVLISNLLTIILWFNPFSWLYKKEIIQNLEFIADRQANTKSKSLKSYQKLLLKTSLSQNQLSISNNFYQSLIKKRIIMLQKSKSKNVNLLKLTFVIPLTALFLMSFNTKEVYIAKNETNLDKIEQTEISVITSKSTDKDLKSIKKDLENQGDGIEIKFSEIERNNNQEITSLSINAKSKNNEDYKQLISVSSKNTPIDDIALKVENNELILLSKENKDYQKISFLGNPKNDKSVSDKLNNLNSEILIIKDGKTITKKKELDNTPKEKIKSVNILKEEIAINKYGEKGKNGVIEVYTKKENPWKINNKVNVVTVYEAEKNPKEETLYIDELNNTNPKVLFIKNNKEITKEEFNKISTKDIKSVYVLKDDKAVTKYGDKGKDGVIEIYTKENHWKINNEVETVSVIKTDTDLNQDDLVFLNQKLNNPDSKPLIIKDDKEITNKEIQDIMHSSIKSISILKDKSAIAKYGEKGKNGVIIITTK